MTYEEEQKKKQQAQEVALAGMNGGAHPFDASSMTPEEYERITGQSVQGANANTVASAYPTGEWTPEAITRVLSPAPDAQKTPSSEYVPSFSFASPSATPSAAPQDAQSSPTFADMLLRNEDLMKREQEQYALKQKEANSRKTFAAIADGLSSLANLVGTAHGAINQEQTFQMPFIQQQDENDRNYYRNRIDALRQQNENIRMYQAKQDAENDVLGQRHANTMEEIAARAVANQETEGVKQQGRIELEGEKQKGRMELEQARTEYKRERDAVQAALRGASISISSRRLDELTRHNGVMEEIRKAGASGNGTSKITPNALAQLLDKDAQMDAGALEQEVMENNGGKLPVGWRAMKWNEKREYIRQYAPNFYDEHYGELWEDLIQRGYANYGASGSSNNGGGSNKSGGKVKFNVPASGNTGNAGNGGGKKSNLY